MPKFAQFDPAAPAPQPVIGWYDTDFVNYPNLPPASNLLELTQDQWNLRLSTPFVQNGALVAAPMPTAAQLLADAQATTWLKIKAKRAAIELGGVKVGMKWYHTDDASRIKYLGLFKLAEQALAAGSVGTTVLQYGGVDIRWKTMDGTFINMTVQRAQDVYFAVFGLDMAAFAAAETHKTAMEAAADPAAYDFSAGWPASYL